MWTFHTVTLTHIFQSASYISNNTDDDDISAFVQDIDARKPLRRALSDRRRPLGTNPEQADDLRSPPRGGIQDGSPAPRINDKPPSAGINGIGEPLLTNVSDIDQRLKEMTDAFTARLAGLSGTAPSTRTGGGPGGGLDSRDRSVSRERPLTTRGAIPPEIYDLSRRRRSSIGSVRSGLSIGSEEVIGKLELEDKRKSKGV